MTLKQMFYVLFLIYYLPQNEGVFCGQGLCDCLMDIYTIDCTDRNLDKLPEFQTIYKESTETLFLDNNNIKFISFDRKKWVSLETVHVKNNPISCTNVDDLTERGIFVVYNNCLKRPNSTTLISFTNTTENALNVSDLNTRIRKSFSTSRPTGNLPTIRRRTSPSRTPGIINRSWHVTRKPTTAQEITRTMGLSTRKFRRSSPFLQSTTKLGTSVTERRLTKPRENVTPQLLPSTFMGGRGVVGYTSQSSVVSLVLIIIGCSLVVLVATAITIWKLKGKCRKCMERKRRRNRRMYRRREETLELEEVVCKAEGPSVIGSATLRRRSRSPTPSVENLLPKRD